MLVYKARRRERELFPEFRKENRYTDLANHYTFFGPSHHLSDTLVTPQMIEGMKQGRSMLSVGAGPAYLERYLVEQLQVPIEQITLADISSRMPDGFRRYQFNMYKPWPELHQRFDYTIFPESFMRRNDLADYSGNIPDSEVLTRRVISSALQCRTPAGQIRMNGWFSDEVICAVQRLSEEHPEVHMLAQRILIVIQPHECYGIRPRLGEKQGVHA